MKKLRLDIITLGTTHEFLTFWGGGGGGVGIHFYYEYVVNWTYNIQYKNDTHYKIATATELPIELMEKMEIR